MRAEVDWESCGDVYEVSVVVRLDRSEISQLFLLGDILVSWPTAGLVLGESSAPLARGCMYVSELQSRAEGLSLCFVERAQAEHAVLAVREQLAEAEKRLTAGSDTPAGSWSGAQPEEPLRGLEDPVDGHDHLRDLVAGYLGLPGVAAALLVSSQGFLIASAETDPVDTQAIAALVADVVAAVLRLGDSAGGGPLDTIDVEFRDFGLTIAPFDEDVSLILVRPPVAPRVGV